MLVITSFVSLAASLDTYAAPTRKTWGHAVRESGRYFLQTDGTMRHDIIRSPILYLSTVGMF